MGHNLTTAPEKFIATSLRNTISEPKIQQTKIAVTNYLYKAEIVYEGRLNVSRTAISTGIPYLN